MSMPDKWEYPWFAAWDLGFHCVALAHVDPAFAKYQLLLLCREWFQHPNGALPAYEWDFGDVNPPVQAWAALEVFAIDGAGDLDFLSRVFDKLLVNFTWWVNLEDSDGSNLFEGGFLGSGQHRAARPVAPARRRHPRAVRRHRVDGVLRARHGGHRVDPQPLRPSPGVGPGAQVPRALRGDPPGDGHVRRVGRRRRPVLRPARSPRTAPPSRSRSVRWSASSRCSPRSSSTSPNWLGPRPSGKGFARLVEDFGGRKGLTEQGLIRGEPGAQRRAARRRRRGPAGEAARQAVRRGRVPVAVRAPRRLGVPPRAPLRARRRGRARHDRLRAGRVDDLDVRRQLELAGADLVPAQLPVDQRPRSLRPVLRRRLPRRVPHRERVGAAAWHEIAADLRAGSLPCSCAVPTVGVRASAASTGCSTTRRGRTTSCSTSTSTATTAPGSARPTRPAGPA